MYGDPRPLDFRKDTMQEQRSIVKAKNHFISPKHARKSWGIDKLFFCACSSLPKYTFPLTRARSKTETRFAHAWPYLRKRRIPLSASTLLLRSILHCFGAKGRQSVFFLEEALDGGIICLFSLSFSPLFLPPPHFYRQELTAEGRRKGKKKGLKENAFWRRKYSDIVRIV